MIQPLRLGVLLAAIATSAAGAVAPSAAGAPSRFGHIAFIDHVRVSGGDVRSLAVTRSGMRHWLALGQEYYSLAPGASKATRRVLHVDKSFEGSTPELAEIVPSVDGRRIDVVSANCSSMQVFQVGQNRRMPPEITPSQNVASSSCNGPNLTSVISAVGLAHNRVAVVVADDPSGTSYGRPALYIGRPGQQFRHVTLPNTGDGQYFAFATITRDPHDGALYVAAISGRDLRIWYARTSHRPFRELPSSDAHFSLRYLESIAASHGAVWLSFSGARNHRGITLLHRSPAGHWSHLMTIPHSTRQLAYVLVAAGPKRSKQPRFWEANTVVRRSNGLLANEGVDLRRLTSQIGRVHHYTQRRRDRLEGLAVGWHGQHVVGHQVY